MKWLDPSADLINLLATCSRFIGVYRSLLAKTFGVDPGVPLFAKVEG